MVQPLLLCCSGISLSWGELSQQLTLLARCYQQNWALSGSNEQCCQQLGLFWRSWHAYRAASILVQPLVLTQLCCSYCCVLQMVQGLPLPLLKICDFGYSKAHFMSAPKSKVGINAMQEQLRWSCRASIQQGACSLLCLTHNLSSSS